MTFPKNLKDLGYTEEELEKDSPYSQWREQSFPVMKHPLVPEGEVWIMGTTTYVGMDIASKADDVTSEEEDAFNKIGGTTMNQEERKAVGGIQVSDSDFDDFDKALRAEQLQDISKDMFDTEGLGNSEKLPLVIYHGNCADGFGAAWVFHYVSRLTKAKFEFHKGVYGDDIPDVDDRTVYIVDFSYSPADMHRIKERCSTLIWLDHHISAIKALMTGDDDDIQFDTDIVHVVADVNRSGAVIAWDYWADVLGHVMGEMPLLLGHIQDRDLWKFKLHNTEAIQANLFSYEYEFDLWDKLMTMDQIELLKFSVAGAAITRKHHKDIAELLKVCQRLCVIDGYEVPVASLPYTMSSDACHKMAKEYVEGRYFAACYWDTEDSRKFSLRSAENGMDVSEIAKKFGGGGHKHAAGFSVHRSHTLAMF